MRYAQIPDLQDESDHLWNFMFRNVSKAAYEG